MNTTDKLAAALRAMLAANATNGHNMNRAQRDADESARAALELAEADAPRASGPHPSEPWRVTQYRKGAHTIIGSAPDYIAHGALALVECSRPQAQDIARRIVACVNACAGLPTAMLEDFTPDPDAIAAYLRATGGGA